MDFADRICINLTRILFFSTGCSADDGCLVVDIRVVSRCSCDGVVYVYGDNVVLGTLIS